MAELPQDHILGAGGAACHTGGVQPCHGRAAACGNTCENTCESVPTTGTLEGQQTCLWASLLTSKVAGFFLRQNTALTL